MAFTAANKIKKEKGAAATPFETSVAQYLFDFESGSSAEVKAQLKSLYIVGAKEIELSNGAKAAVVFVPYRQLRDFRRVQVRLVNELEKKLSGVPVMIVAQRRIIPKPGKNNTVKMQKRPMSRTLTAVHAAILDDLVYPAEVSGRRTRIRVDGKQVQTITLDAKEEHTLEHKLATFSGVYKRLTGKDALFQFPQNH